MIRTAHKLNMGVGEGDHRGKGDPKEHAIPWLHLKKSVIFVISV